MYLEIFKIIINYMNMQINWTTPVIIIINIIMQLRVNKIKIKESLLRKVN